VLLGGDDDEGAAVELASALGGVDVLPQPCDRSLRVAVLAVVIRSRSRLPFMRVLVRSLRGSSTTSRMPPAAIRAIRSPVCVYGELSWSAPSSAWTNYADGSAMPQSMRTPLRCALARRLALHDLVLVTSCSRSNIADTIRQPSRLASFAEVLADALRISHRPWRDPDGLRCRPLLH
jgi:hypothetical protein